MPKSPTELKSYVDNLSGILHLIAGETQTLVRSFKDVNTYVRNIVNQTAKSTDADTMMQQSTVLTQQLTMTIQPLAEELRRLLGEEDYSTTQGNPSAVLDQLVTLASQLEELFTSIVVEFTIGVVPDNVDEVESKLRQYEVQFPTTILTLLKLFRANIATHVDKMQKEQLPQINKTAKPKNFSAMPASKEASPEAVKKTTDLVRGNSLKRNVKPNIADKVQKYEEFTSPVSPVEDRRDGGLSGALNNMNNLNDLLSKKAAPPLSKMANDGRQGSATKLIESVPHYPTGVLNSLQTEQVNNVRRMSVQADYMVTALQKKNPQLAAVSSTGNLIGDQVKPIATEPKSYSGNLVKSQLNLTGVSNEGLQQSTAQNSKNASKFDLSISSKNQEVYSSMNTFSDTMAKDLVRMSQVESKASPLTELNHAASAIGSEIDRQSKLDADAPPLPVKDRQSYYPKLDKVKKQEAKVQVIKSTSVNQLSKIDVHTKSIGSIHKKDKYLKDYIPPTAEEDAKFLDGFPINSKPEIILQAMNGYQLLPGASPQAPYLNLDLSKPARLGRSNTDKVPNFTVVGMTQVISRNHLEFSCNDSVFYVQDVGSNSGTWLNGQRLSDAGVVSEKFPIITGDIVRVGADFKQSAKDEEVRDIRHKCIIVRAVVRLPAQVETGLQSFSTKAVANQTMTDLMPTIRKQEDVRMSKTIQLVSNDSITTKQALRKSSLQDMSSSVEQQNKFNVRSDMPKEATLPASKYFLAYSASTLPFKIRRLAIHNPANAIDFGHPQQSKGDYESTEKIMGLVGPEIMSVNLSKWGQQNLRQKIVVHDLRIPFSLSDDSQVRRYGTALEIVKETGSDTISLIVLTGEPYSAQDVAGDRSSVRMPNFKKTNAFKLGTIDLNSPYKCQVNMCFIPLPGYITDTVLNDPGPTTCQGSIPPSRQTIYPGGAGYKFNKNFQSSPKPQSPVVDRLPYEIAQIPIGEASLPSLVIVGELGNISNVSRFGFSNTSPISANSSSPVSSQNEVPVDKSKTVIVLKRPIPSRLQKLIAEIRGKQVVKKSVRETKWVVGLEVTEELLWSELEQAAQNTGGKEMIAFESTITSDGIKWVYRKEWWSLALLGSMIYASVKEQQSV